jgi:hypothetical protein
MRTLTEGFRRSCRQVGRRCVSVFEQRQVLDLDWIGQRNRDDAGVIDEHIA